MFYIPNLTISPHPLHYCSVGQAPLRTSLLQAEYEDLQSAMGTVQDLIERQSIPVFNNIKVALNCTTKVLKENFF